LPACLPACLLACLPACFPSFGVYDTRAVVSAFMPAEEKSGYVSARERERERAIGRASKRANAREFASYGPMIFQREMGG